jgi:NAD(P)H-quinone oxidoreductase subunit N
MPLLTTGKGLIRDLEKSGALALFTPLEGGYEGRYQRRLRAAGYQSLTITARGLGDLSAYLMNIHGVRPPHLGKKNIGLEAAVGPVYFIPPVARYQLETLPPQSKGLVLWILEGFVLSDSERQYLIALTQTEPRLKVVLEMGGERFVRWQPLADCLRVA